jgi:heat shock protein HtpX
MPSTPSFSAGLWVRVGLASVLLLLVGAALFVAEASVFGTLAYGVLVVVYHGLEGLSVDPALALVGTVATLGVGAAVVFGGYSAARRAPDEAVVAFRVLFGVGTLLVVASLAVTYWVIDALGLPQWSFALVVVALFGGIYVFIGVQVAAEWSDDDSSTGSSDDAPDWSVDDDDGQPPQNPTKIDEFRTVLGELRRLLGAARGRVGLAGLAAGAVTLGAGFAGLCALAAGTNPESLLVPLAAGAGVVAAGYHLADAVRTERRGATVLRDVEERFGPAVDDERRRMLQRRVARLAAQLDIPAPDVRLVSARTPTAMAVGYRPSTSTLVVSTGLVDALDDGELDAVLAHELTHVSNRDAAVLTALSVPRVAARRTFDRFGANPVVVLFAAAVAATGRLCVAVVARAREYAADDGAVAVTGDPAALASALETLDDELGRRPDADLRDSAAGAFAIVPPPWEEHPFFDRVRRLVARRLLGTHPPTDRRIERLRLGADDATESP